MNFPVIRRSMNVKMLFVWDGTTQSVKVAEKFCKEIDKLTVTSVYVMPHESVLAYTTVVHSPDEPTSFERRLHATYERATRSSAMLRNTKLQLVFGERIDEIARLVSVIHAQFVLMPVFKQSMFSHWIHGDLNLRLKEKTSCEIVYYDHDENGCSLLEDDIEQESH